MPDGVHQQDLHLTSEADSAQCSAQVGAYVDTSTSLGRSFRLKAWTGLELPVVRAFQHEDEHRQISACGLCPAAARHDGRVKVVDAPQFIGAGLAWKAPRLGRSAELAPHHSGRIVCKELRDPLAIAYGNHRLPHISGAPFKVLGDWNGIGAIGEQNSSSYNPTVRSSSLMRMG
jgi:hypothetical protein